MCSKIDLVAGYVLFINILFIYRQVLTNTTTKEMATALKELDVVLCFDTTASMTSVLKAVRKNLTNLNNTLFSNDQFDCKIAVIAHGDYDSHKQYVVKHADFTNNQASISSFITNVENINNSWNEGEAYEQALHTMKTLSWRVESKKIVILVGDDNPHPPHFPGNTNKIDWIECLKYLTEMDICIYAVQCASLEIARASAFYKALGSAHKHSKYILLDQFYMMPELIIGVFLHAMDDISGLEKHEEEMKKSAIYNKNIGQTFDRLLGRTTDIDYDVGTPSHTAYHHQASSHARGSASSHVNAQQVGKIPVSTGRFQRLRVDTDSTIKDFVVSSGAVFQAGRGFYELTKSEKVSATKEIILEEIATGDMFNGTDARTIIGLSLDTDATVNPKKIANGDLYRVYIQSTSYTRKLIGGTWFLYEISNI